MTQCKYCKKSDHQIDSCPDIICRLCKQYGHPHWRCKNIRNNQSPKDIIRPLIIASSTLPPPTATPVVSEKGGSVEDFYKYQDAIWGDLI